MWRLEGPAGNEVQPAGGCKGAPGQRCILKWVVGFGGRTSAPTGGQLHLHHLQQTIQLFRKSMEGGVEPADGEHKTIASRGFGLHGGVMEGAGSGLSGSSYVAMDGY